MQLGRFLCPYIRNLSKRLSSARVMGKGSKRPRKDERTTPYKKRSGKDNPFPEDDSDDEIDTFHKQRDVIPLDVDDDDAVDLDDDLECPVLDVEGAAADDSDEVRSDDSYDDDIHDDKEITKMARQAKYLEQMNGGGDELSDDSEPEKESRTVWGRKKSSYYDADNRDFELQSSDDELFKEELAEVLKMQRERASGLQVEDYGLPGDSDSDQDESDSGQEKTFEDILGGKKTKSNVDGILEGTPFESHEDIKIQRDINALSKEEKMDVVYSSAPDLVGLLSELNEAHNQLEKLKPLLSKMRENKDPSRGGMHSLMVKHILLSAYCQAISFYLLLRSEGHSVRDHPVIARIAEIKNLYEKMKLIDVNLSSLVEERFSHNLANDSQDKLVKEKVPSERKPDMREVSAKPYEVPLVNKAAQLVDDHSKNYQAKIAIQKDQDVPMSLQSMEMLKVRANLEAKLKQKGIYNLTKRNQNHALTPVNRHFETLDDFGDEVQQVCSGINNVPARSKISQMVSQKARKPKFLSGDDDLPKRDDIGERRRKHELRFLARAGDDDLPERNTIGEKRRENELRVLEGAGGESMDIDVQEDGEDELYREQKKKRVEKLQAKAELYGRVMTSVLPLESEADGKRNISYQIEKNRGLTRHRKKETKTPRKKYRVKYKDVQKRRKGQVRDIRKPSGPYGGESTGINTGTSHSIRFSRMSYLKCRRIRCQ